MFNYYVFFFNLFLNLIKIVAFAYQVNTENEHCHRLSKDIDGGPMEWSLINEDDPSDGIKLHVKNGDYSSTCENPSKNREFTLTFRCEPGQKSLALASKAQVQEHSGILSFISYPSMIYICQKKILEITSICTWNSP